MLRDDTLTGRFMMILAALFFATMALFVRIAARDASVGTISFVRYGMTVAVYLPFIAAGSIKIRPVNMRLIVLRAIAASFGGIFFFLAVSEITLAEATILKYTFPLFAVTISAIFYKERTNLLVVGLMIWSFAGVYIMVNPESLAIQRGYLWGILNAVSAGAAVAFLRKLRETDDSLTILFTTAIAGTVMSIPVMIADWRTPTLTALGLMIIISLCGLLAQFFITYGMRFIKTGAGSVIMMLEVVFATVLGMTFLHHVPTPHQIIGGVMILGGGVVLAMRGKTESDIRSSDKMESIDVLSNKPFTQEEQS